MKPTVVVGAVAVLLIGYLLYRLGLGDLIGLGRASSSSACNGAEPLKAPTLARMYEFSQGLAKAWKPDAVVVRLDNLAMTAPLQPDGSSTEWTTSYYSAAAKSTLMIHTGDGQLHCSTFGGESADNIPDVKPAFMRDGVVLYGLAEKNGRDYLAKGLGIGLVLFASGDRRATWRLGFYDHAGYSKGPKLVVDANTGALEEVSKP